MEHWIFLRAEFDKPKHRWQSTRQPKPLQKTSPPVKILPNITGLRTDEQYDDFLLRNRRGTVIINYGSSWCAHCHQLFPHFLALSHLFPNVKYAVAQVDYLHEAAKNITYTPTFTVFRNGKRVDEFYGPTEQQLSDRVWLWGSSALNN